MDESLPQPMAPPPRQKPKPVHKNNSLAAAQVSEPIPDAWPSGNRSTISSNSNNVISNNVTSSNVVSNDVANTSNVSEIDEQTEMDEREAAYIEDSIEHDEKGEACEWHLAAMLDGTYMDPFSVPAKYLIEQEFARIKTVADEFQHVLEENKKRHDENLKRRNENSQQKPE